MAERLAEMFSMAFKLQLDCSFGGTSYEEIFQRARNHLAVQLDAHRGPEHDNAGSGCSARPIEAGKGSAAKTAAEEKEEGGEEAGYANAESSYAAFAIARRSAFARFASFGATAFAGDLERRLVGPARLELATFWFVARRSIQLSYGPASGRA